MNRYLRMKAAAVLAAVVGAAVPLVLWGLSLGVDLKGGVQFVLRINVQEALDAGSQAMHDEIVAHTREAIDRRINELGVVEPTMAVQGPNRDELLIQLPGFTDAARAQAVLGATARLEWKLVKVGAEPAESSLESTGLGGRDIRTASVIADEYGLPSVGFTLTADGGRRFADLTSANVGRRLAIVLDGRIHSAPVIETPITGGEGTIRGGFNAKEAADLALLLRAGALPVSLTFLGGQYVGPTLGADSIRAGIAASTGGLILVAAFMLVYYRRAGLNAVVSVAANLLLLLGAMAALGASLTLPGIAGLVLTIGMGVDSNVLIFERIKEELKAGRTVRAAVGAGFDRVFLTILDTHAASLVAAAFLFHFGTGAIRGFATTLTIGLLTNVFASVVLSRTLFEVELSRRGAAPKLATFAGSARARTIDIMAWRRPAAMASVVFLAAIVGGMIARGGPSVGLDFTGGTALVARFDAPVSDDAVRAQLPADASVQRYGGEPNRTMLIRVAQRDSQENPRAAVDRVKAALDGGTLPAFEITGSETVGPSIGRDLQRKGTYATIASLAGIAGYIALRFRPSFALGAAVATAHDIAVTVGLLSIAGYDLTLNVVAAVLTIAGYSVNDTIVIFDRVRENLRRGSPMPVTAAVNLAVNQTLGRTIITAGTTLLSVLALYLFGGDALRGFAFAMLVGIAAGTYSTVFVAAPIAAYLRR